MARRPYNAGIVVSASPKAQDRKELIAREIEHVPEALREELLDFIRVLKAKDADEKAAITLLSESSLKKDWLRPEEDEAWRHLGSCPKTVKAV
jgi:hypothetical protein